MITPSSIPFLRRSAARRLAEERISSTDWTEPSLMKSGASESRAAAVVMTWPERVSLVVATAIAVADQQDPVGREGPVRDPAAVQPQHDVPDPPELVVRRRLGQLGQRRAGVALVGQHGGLRAHPDQGAQAGRWHASVLRRVGKQGPPLDGPLDGERGAARYLRPQPQPAIQPVEHVGRLLTMYLAPDDVMLVIEIRFHSTTTAANIRRAAVRLKASIRAKYPRIHRIFFDPETICD